ncbi:MAG: hypothetical protein ACE5NP_12875 [Anaerolineae bacterium]
MADGELLLVINCGSTGQRGKALSPRPPLPTLGEGEFRTGFAAAFGLSARLKPPFSQGWEKGGWGDEGQPLQITLLVSQLHEPSRNSHQPKAISHKP